MHYKDLEVWEKSVDLALVVYAITARFPAGETYGMTAQMRRAGISIPSNIAEGQGRSSDRDNRRFVLNARGSLYELESQVLIAGRLGYLTPEEKLGFDSATDEVGHLINGMLRHLKRKMFGRINRQPKNSQSSAEP